MLDIVSVLESKQSEKNKLEKTEEEQQDKLVRDKLILKRTPGHGTKL